MTAALEGCEWSAACPGRTLPPGKIRYPLYRRLGGPQGRSGRAENLVSTGIRSRTVQPVDSRNTDWATRPLHNIGNQKWFCNPYNFVTTWPTLILMIPVNWPPSDYHLFPELKQNLGSYVVRCYRQSETVVSRRMIIQERNWVKRKYRSLSPYVIITSVVTKNMWKISAIPGQLNLTHSFRDETK